MDEQLELNRETLKALASDTRIDILKELTERKKTVTELSDALNMSKSTTHEHLLRLTEASLVRKIASPNKWIYYDLTRKGLELIKPSDKRRVILLLSSSLLAFAVGGYQVANFIQVKMQRVMMTVAPEAADVSETAIISTFPTSLITGITLAGIGILLAIVGIKIRGYSSLRNRTLPKT